MALLLGGGRETRHRRAPQYRSVARMVAALRVSLELLRIVVDVAQVAGAVAQDLIVEMRRRRVAALAAGSDCFRVHALAEFDGRDEAVAARAVELLHAAEYTRSVLEGGERAPAR